MLPFFFKRKGIGMKPLFYNTIIIGGGASGLMCGAVCAKKHRTKNVLILERQPRIGKKLLATGNGKCNLTNLNISENKYHGSMDLSFLICCISPEILISHFENIGLFCTADNEGRVYPQCRQASAVLDVLRLENERQGVQIRCNVNVQSVHKKENSFIIKTDTELFQAEKVVFATGGKASPGNGGNASGLDLLKNLGHTVVKPLPCLLPVDVQSDLIKSLKGIRVSGRVQLLDGQNKIASETGEIQFTDTALSGICVFNLSTLIHKTKNPVLQVSLLPKLSEEKIYILLEKRKQIFRTNTLDAYFCGLFHKRIGEALLKSTDILPFSKKIADLKDTELKKLAYAVNHWNFQAMKPASFTKAQVMSGGVPGREINYKTMESRLVPGLFICGEATDCNGDCGGYNLHYAFSSGILAGENV